MSIVYNFYNIASHSMEQETIDVNDLVRYMPKGQRVFINTNIKYHCDIDSYDDFIIEVNNGKVINTSIIDDINKYLRDNNSRSYFFEGLVSRGNGKYYLQWSS